MASAGGVQAGAGDKKSRWTYVENGHEYVTTLSAIIFLIGIFGSCAIIWYLVFMLTPTANADPWEAVMEAHHDAGMACHAALVDRIDHMTGVLYGGPYTVGESTSQSMVTARDLAISMVLDGDVRPPECGG